MQRSIWTMLAPHLLLSSRTAGSTMDRGVVKLCLRDHHCQSDISLNRKRRELCSAAFWIIDLLYLLEVQAICNASYRAQLVSFVGLPIVRAHGNFVRWAISQISQITKSTCISPTDHAYAAARGCMSFGVYHQPIVAVGAEPNCSRIKAKSRAI